MGWGWGDLANAIPGVNILYNAGASGYDYATGDTAGGNQHAKNLAGDALTAGWYGTGQEAVKAGKAGWSALKNAYDAPFEEKRLAIPSATQSTPSTVIRRTGSCNVRPERHIRPVRDWAQRHPCQETAGVRGYGSAAN
jgi:hypothetical protein